MGLVDHSIMAAGTHGRVNFLASWGQEEGGRKEQYKRHTF
jgi:hypothetical protein